TVTKRSISKFFFASYATLGTPKSLPDKGLGDFLQFSEARQGIARLYANAYSSCVTWTQWVHMGGAESGPLFGSYDPKEKARLAPGQSYFTKKGMIKSNMWRANAVILSDSSNATASLTTSTAKNSPIDCSF
ncbi:hypothetical protein, partial [Burkholderia sp. L27(2015)]|uniref:hypothetical protein n=1 Tax=Burkholderia sp. L27(2015) TaxID=1641858 RepID=UPI001C20271E